MNDRPPYSTRRAERAARDAFLGAGTVGFFGHERPDGDCVGTAAAAALWLQMLGKRTELFLPGGVPERYLFLVEELGLNINPASPGELDVACAIDTSSVERLAEFAEIFSRTPLSVVIDHHPDNSMSGDIQWVEPEASSVAELVFRMIGEEDIRRTGGRAAVALYAGIMTDTGKFSYSNTTPETLRAAAALVEMGAEPQALTDLLYRSRSAEELLIEGEFLSSLRLYEGDSILVMSVSRDFMKRFPDVSVEDLAARTLEVKGVLAGVMLLEIAPGQVKISLRGRDGIDVGAAARRLGGGGHLPASGTKMKGDIARVEAAVLKEIKTAIRAAEKAGRLL